MRQTRLVRLMVTNDDGIESEGIHVLVRVLHQAGHEVVVAAPDRDWSGAGASLGRLHPDDTIDVTRVEIPGCPAVPAYAVAGPPALTVLAARLGAFGAPPDYVVSGINAGLNTGRSILHSGTVGAALTGQNFGISGLAVSVAWGDEWYWETAARCALQVFDHLLRAPARTVLNLNVPAVPFERLPGVRWARLAPFGAVRAAMADASEGRLQMELTATDGTAAADTDQGTVDAGYASLTTLVGVVEAWPAAGDDELDAGVPIHERVVPGINLEAVHRVPDGSEHRSLRRPDLGIV
jgi:5'-nucleotidase